MPTFLEILSTLFQVLAMSLLYDYPNTNEPTLGHID